MKFTANLTGSILCPYQILVDIVEQLPNCPAPLKNLAFAPICELNSTNDWINLESFGKPVAIRAKVFADKLSLILKNQQINDLSIDIFINDELFNSDNLYSLIFLAQNLDTITITFYTNSSTALKPQLEALNSLNNLKFDFSSKKLTAIQEGSLDTLLNARILSIQKIGFRLDDSLLAKDYAPSTINQLIGYAWLCLKAGGYGIACHLLEQAKNSESVAAPTQEQLFMHLFMIRFFSHQYAFLAVSDFPQSFSHLSDSEVQTLLFLKAYAATLSRHIPIAAEFFVRCGISPSMVLTDENSLYHLNLHALFQVLQGQTDTAFELEFRIKEFIAAKQITTVGLKYVNFINIARLYKKTKQFDLALDYYNQAYNEISQGAYATSDHIYYNMNLGSLFEAAANYEQALECWVKVAMHWLSFSNPYELSWRPRLILCQENIADIEKPLPIEKANDFLIGKITELMGLCSLTLNANDRQAFHFTADSISSEKESCFVHKSIVFYSTLKAQSSTKAFSKSKHQLAEITSRCLNALLDIPSSVSNIIVDAHLDTKVLTSAEDAIAYAQFANCHSCYFNGQRFQVKEFTTLKSLAASLSSSIHSIDRSENGLSIVYKRSFMNKVLTDVNEIAFVQGLKANSTITLSDLDVNSRIVVQKLAQKRVLSFG